MPLMKTQTGSNLIKGLCFSSPKLYRKIYRTIAVSITYFFKLSFLLLLPFIPPLPFALQGVTARSRHPDFY